MNELMRQAMLAVAVASLMAATTGRAPAGTIVDFSYYGRGGPDEAGLISTGTGSFAFADSLSTVGLADLTSFDFTLSENTPNTAIFGLPDLVTPPVPEPSTFTLAVLGTVIIASGWCRRRKSGAVFGRISVDHHEPAPGRK